jgi:RNA polymerase sigma factor (sigma-70 family)
MRRTDKELLIACRKGDESSWEALVDRYQRLIYTIPRRAGLNQDQASEVFQDVFVTLLEKLDDINEPDRLHAWLVTAARRKTWRFVTRERSFKGQDSDREDDDDNGLAAIVDNNPLPDEVLLQVEEQHRVRTAVAELDERCQKLLTMLYYQTEPPPYAEIADTLGTSEGSIGPTRARCLKKLLRLLEE